MEKGCPIIGLTSFASQKLKNKNKKSSIHAKAICGDELLQLCNIF